MSNIIFLTDPHIKAVGGKNRDNAHELARYIVGEEDASSSIVAISGDIMDSPTRRNAEAARRWIDVFRDGGFEVIAVPGNHDLYMHGIDAGLWIQAIREPWDEFIEPALSWDMRGWPRTKQWNGVQLIGLDTMQGTVDDIEVDLAQGRVGRKQLGRLTLLLQDTPSVVIGHHRVWWKDTAHLLEDAADLHEIMKGRALGYLCGHQHRRVRSQKVQPQYHAAHRCTQRHKRQLRYDVIPIDLGMNHSLKYVK